MSQWDPVAAKLLPLYPEPNLPGAVRNFYYNPKERLSADAYNVRIDHHIGPKDSMFGRISQNFGQQSAADILPEPANQPGFTDLKAGS